MAGLVVALLVILGGCASNASRNWAQTAPVITPTSTGESIISLGAVERGS